MTALLSAQFAVLGTGAANAQPGATEDPVYQVTYVARVCDEYTDVMANRARNDIQESLRDLGPDTVYNAGDPISYDQESQVPSQQSCQPLVDWRLSMGPAFTGKTPETLELSTVTSPYDTEIVTAPSTPVLDQHGQPTGEQVEGAVTVPMTAEQLGRAQQPNGIWVQGGTPDAPLNGLQEQYGFAALRCSVDGLNGDNVETVSFPADTQHVFCYYYAVSPPPDAGKIVVRKELGPNSSGPQQFDFAGNVSYNAGGAFNLTAAQGEPGEIEFVRGAVTGETPPWQFSELPTPGWELVNGEPTCDSEAGTSVVTVTGPDVSVTLAGGDTVTCTYVNQRPVTGPLTLSKVSLGGTGAFPFTVTRPDGSENETVATTTEESKSVVVAESVGGPPGTYTATETLPAPSSAGEWTIIDVQCNGEPVPFVVAGQEVTAELDAPADEPQDCLFVNRFTAFGSIAIDKVSEGGTGTFGYTIRPLAPNHPVPLSQSATTTEEGVPVTAGGDPTSGLPVTDDGQAYLIRELSPPATTEGSWTVTDIDCGPTGVVENVAHGVAIVTISTATPNVECSFTNAFVPTSRLVLAKETQGPAGLRTGEVQIGVQCSDGSDFSLTLPPGEAAATADPWFFYEPVDCTVTENANGAGENVVVTTTITVDDGSGAPPQVVDGASTTLSLEPGDDVTATVVDIYAQSPPGPTPTPPPPGPNPPPGPGPEPPAGPPGDALANTGSTVSPWWFGAAALLIATGTMALVAVRRRQ